MNITKLIALDIDGTLINSKHQVSAATRQAIYDAQKLGAEIVVSTGRVYNALPHDILKNLNIRYAITTNGAAVYRLSDGKCIYEKGMEQDMFLPILEKLQACDILIHLYMDGECYHTSAKYSVIDKMDVSEKRKEYLRSIGCCVEDLYQVVRKKGSPVQKVTLAFYPLPDGTYKHHEELDVFLRSNSLINTVCGGDTTLEITKAGVEKGTGLIYLADYLKVPMERTIACGDSENDLSIVKTANIGVAMENASQILKDAADYITASNDEDGVAKMLKKYVLNNDDLFSHLM